MCTTDFHTYIYPDGHKETVSRPSLCPSSRHNQPCSNNILFNHAAQSVPYGRPVAPAFGGPSSYRAPYLRHFPPSPSYTPRPSTPNYRSGDESDRSYHSSSSARRRHSGVHVNVQRAESDRHGRDRRERILLVDNPPTPRTPPQAFAFPSSAPSSPSFASSSPFIVDTHPRGSTSRRPVIVDERTRHDRDRPHIQIELVDGHRKNRHTRQTSASSHDSRNSYTSASEDDEWRRRRLELEQLGAERRRQAQEEEIRQSNLRARIAKANAEIASRQAVPVAPAPLKRSSTSSAAKAAPSAKGREEELLDAVRRLDIKEKKREDRGRVERREEKEGAGQRHRLMQRMIPTRRATVGPGSRRHRVEYDDGVYRWE
ncbi:hypothetical protein C2857_007064 [Epichloe festucae Fl1]|uniref:Uncharacterized protein n=1 Tax=Epichloe festucae (strain Fl1) TaxID=877507 RepID=A0A7S9KTU1_EPIFF|nr:hypothetical protein C2857_007064 [Epichloe festucae Fl1]